MSNKVVSFKLIGEFAAFRDPSVTSNQTVSHIPSKMAVIGVLGAMLGVPRSDKLVDRYSTQYLELLAKVKIGIEVVARSEKTVFYTNHRSFKEAKTKPVKSELLVRPQYIIYVASEDQALIDELFSRVSRREFVFPPYLGHAYCPAMVSDAKLYEASAATGMFKTATVVLDENSVNGDSSVDPTLLGGSSVILDDLLYHFMNDGRLSARALRHWVPIASKFLVEFTTKPKFVTVLKLDDGSIVCVY
nr:CRISPR-associated protein Cas5 [Ferrimicrobium acidiphilum]